MAQPAGTQPDVEEPPLPDPAAIHHEIRLRRARRNARLQRAREAQYARLRFWFVLAGLFLGLLVLIVTIWDQIQRLFGL